MSLLVVSCNNFEKERFDEELTLAVFVESGNTQLIDNLKSVNVYKIKTDRFHSEDWLIKNSLSSFRITNKESIKKIVEELNYNNSSSFPEKLDPQGLEYHVIAVLSEKQKAYLRLIKNNSCSDCFKARPLTEAVYQLNLSDTLMGNIINKLK
jgi:hypothetical protein